MTRQQAAWIARARRHGTTRNLSSHIEPNGNVYVRWTDADSGRLRTQTLPREMV